MTAVDNTGIVLYRYLRALSVKVSWCTVYRLLDTPVGSSMRGISDALDVLHIKNEVYQLPPSADYFVQVESPFITMLQVDKNPFCVVTKKDDSIVEFSNSEGKSHCMKVNTFLKKWTGTVLISETTEETPSDSLYIWKNIVHSFLKHKALIAIFLMISLGVVAALRQEYSPILTAYSSTLGLGILVSAAILYKEQFNDKFLESFCHIGKVVDCNEVLRSKGASIAGVGLGELSLLYFVTLFLFCMLCPENFYGIASLCSVAAFCFTIYSVGYQIFVIRKGCMLCMLVNITIWISAAILYGSSYHSTFHISPFALSAFVAVGCICLTAGISLKALYKDRKEKIVLQQRMAGLLAPEVFQHLLPLEASIEKPIAANIALQNGEGNCDRLMIVTNPNCRNCAKVHRQFEELSSTVSMSMILLTFPNDRIGEHVAQTVITAYLAEGWQKAMSLLEEWYRDRRISEAKKYPVTSEAERMWREQQEYCLKQGINKTPVALTAGHYIPEVYQISELKYVLT